MKMRSFFRFVRLLCLASVASISVLYVQFGPEPWRDLVRYAIGSPHDKYSVSLKWGSRRHRPEASRWLAAAQNSIGSASPLKLPADRSLTFENHAPATAFSVMLRRGQRFHVALGPSVATARVFIDVFERTDDDDLRAVESADAGAHLIEFEPDNDGTYIVRLQAELGPSAALDVRVRSEPTLRLPVQQANRRSIGSFYGDDRDGGSRDHHGVDIFATRGTPVVAAAGGIVTRVGTNGLGGKVVWISRPFRGESHYYAHLDQQLVTVGTRVEAGDVIGRVGTTGNARSTPPHLHFGIYTPRGAVDPLPYIAS